MIQKYLLAVLVDNKPGVLTHVSGLISRRAFNIESISAGYTEDEDVTRINIVDVHPEDLVIELTGTESKIDSFCQVLEGYGIIEIARTGAIALSRGPIPVKQM